MPEHRKKDKNKQTIKGYQLGGGLGSVPQAPIQGGDTDSLLGVVDGQEPIAVSEGEYILRAPVVAFLGGGSTDAGFRALDAFQDQIMGQIEQGGMEQPLERSGDPNEMGSPDDMAGLMGLLGPQV